MAKLAKSPKILAWHFLAESGKMAYRDAPVRAGKTYRCRGPILLCSSGLHASTRILDALNYAPGPICCRVEMGGTIRHGDDKLCATSRKVLAIADITTILHEFACDVAEQALAVAKVEDPRLWAAIEAKRKWLRGEITNEELVAAGAAARAAAWAAAWDVAVGAAGAAARNAAVDVSWAAARGTGRAASWDAQNTMLERRVLSVMGLTESGEESNNER